MRSLLNHTGLWGLACITLIIVGLTLLYRPAETSDQSWYLSGDFDNVDGLKLGSDVLLSGFTVGSVHAIDVLPNLKIRVTIVLNAPIEVPDDSDLRIQSAGLFSAPTLALMPGGGFDLLADGDQLYFTQSSVDFLALFEQIVSNAQNESQSRQK